MGTLKSSGVWGLDFSSSVPRVENSKKRQLLENLKAAQHYDENYGDAMRALNAHNTWKSDWHPVTKLAYVVREDHGVVAQ